MFLHATSRQLVSFSLTLCNNGQPDKNMQVKRPNAPLFVVLQVTMLIVIVFQATRKKNVNWIECTVHLWFLLFFKILYGNITASTAWHDGQRAMTLMLVYLIGVSIYRMLISQLEFIFMFKICFHLDSCIILLLFLNSML